MIKEQEESEGWFRASWYCVLGTPEHSWSSVQGCNPHLRGRAHRNSKYWHLILLLAEELAAVPAMVPSLCQRKPHGAAGTAVSSFILHPVVSSRAAGLVTHRPAEHSASTVTNEDPAVIPAGDTTQPMESPWGRPPQSHTAEEHPVTQEILQVSVDACAGVGAVCVRRQK